MITGIDEESKEEHIGPSAWKRASKSTIRRILVERAAQWGETEKLTAKPLYRAVAHASFRNFLCNAACLHCVHWLFDCIRKLAACFTLHGAVSNFFLAPPEG